MKKKETGFAPYGTAAQIESTYAPIDSKQLAARVRAVDLAAFEFVSIPAEENSLLKVARTTLDEGVDDLAKVGWGILWGASATTEVRESLAQLIELRRSQTPDQLFLEAEIEALMPARAFLTKHGVDWGARNYSRVPFYLMIVADPVDVSFDFQNTLDLEYAVGRLWFDTPDGDIDVGAFNAYAINVVASESAAAKRRHSVGYWATKHMDDPDTEASCDDLVLPLFSGWAGEPTPAADAHATSIAATGPAATGSLLRDWIRDPSGPGLIFTASHGVEVKQGQRGQRLVQGALLSAEYAGRGASDEDARVSAIDFEELDRADGLVAFFFACFSAGTPRTSSYLEPDGSRASVATHAFVSALPQALLRRGALGIIGHVDLVWGLSFHSPAGGGVQRAPYSKLIVSILKGERLGCALATINRKASLLGSELSTIKRDGSNVTDAQLATLWTEYSDAKAYILLGDPAVRPKFAP